MGDTDALAYKVDAINRVKRRHDRGFCDHKTVHALLDSAILWHVSYVIDGQPYCTPTLFWREGTTLYWQTRQSKPAWHAKCFPVGHARSTITTGSA